MASAAAGSTDYQTFAQGLIGSHRECSSPSDGIITFRDKTPQFAKNAPFNPQQENCYENLNNSVSSYIDDSIDIMEEKNYWNMGGEQDDSTYDLFTDFAANLPDSKARGNGSPQNNQQHATTLKRAQNYPLQIGP